jgi:hypothetical protein
MKYKVIGYDSFSHEDFPVGQYDTEEEAVEVAKEKGGVMTLMYVYDPTGKRIFTAGSY